MTNVGKIFTVVVFIFSIFFMLMGVMVLATHKNWRDAVLGSANEPGLKKQLADAQAVNRALQDELNALKTAISQEQVSRRLVIGSLTAKYQAAETQVRNLNDQLAKLTADQGILTKTLETQQANLDKFTNETMALREAIKKAQEERDATFVNYVATMEKFNQASTQLSTLEERAKLLADDVARRALIMAKLGISTTESTDHLAQPVLGEVREVSGNRVVISVGFDDGIREGQELDVYNKGAYRGKVRIVKVEPDKAVGEIIPDYARGRIQRGDSVSNKI